MFEGKEEILNQQECMTPLKTAVLITCLSSTLSIQAWHVGGKIRCPDLSGIEGAVVIVTGNSTEGPFSGSGATDALGEYDIDLPDVPGSYTATIDGSSLPAGSFVVGPASVSFNVTEQNAWPYIPWTLDGAICSDTPPPPPPPPSACWFTGGGAKIDQLLNMPVAQRGPQHSFGGNVYPGCNPDSGDGGNWNHVARDIKLHFKGTHIEVVQCGNVTPPPPPGSTSPVTPFNFIEFQGTGTLKGIQGNRADYGTVTFFARAEDRNEPGTKDSNAGVGIDRYYLRVVDSTGTTRLLISGSTDPNIVHPIEITDGNFQLHVSSCDDPPTP
jgi:hypothetical protein